MSKWDRRFLDLASRVATWSKDPSTKVGACITDERNRLVSLGFNGFARGVEDRMDVSRETRLARMIHAEPNAILFAHRDLGGCVIYVTRPPCSNCASIIIQSGIERVVYPAPDAAWLDRWGTSIDTALEMFSDARVQVCEAAHGE